MKVKEMLNKMFVNSDISGVEISEYGKRLAGYSMPCIGSAIADFGGRKIASFEIRCVNGTHWLKVNIDRG